MLLEEQLPLDFGVDQTATPPEVRERIEDLEVAMKQSEHQIHIEPRHYFAPGLYLREITIPKGALVVGKIHKTTHVNIVSQGEISVLTENGIERIKAPCTIISKPGTKRVGYAHEDTVWTTVHATDETDLVKLESDLIAESHDKLEQDLKPALEGDKLCLG